MASRFNLSQFFDKRADNQGRLYMLVGVQAARHALRARKPYTSYDLKMRLPRSADPRRAQRYAAEFLQAFHDGPGQGHAYGPDSIVRAFPALTKKVRDHWRGY